MISFHDDKFILLQCCRNFGKYSMLEEWPRKSNKIFISEILWILNHKMRRIAKIRVVLSNQNLNFSSGRTLKKFNLHHRYVLTSTFLFGICVSVQTIATKLTWNPSRSHHSLSNCRTFGKKTCMYVDRVLLRCAYWHVQVQCKTLRENNLSQKGKGEVSKLKRLIQDNPSYRTRSLTNPPHEYNLIYSIKSCLVAEKVERD